MQLFQTKQDLFWMMNILIISNISINRINLDVNHVHSLQLSWLHSIVCKNLIEGHRGMSEHVYIAEHGGTKEPPLTQPGDEGEPETECHFSCVCKA